MFHSLYKLHTLYLQLYTAYCIQVFNFILLLTAHYILFFNIHFHICLPFNFLKICYQYVTVSIVHMIYLWACFDFDITNIIFNIHTHTYTKLTKILKKITYYVVLKAQPLKPRRDRADKTLEENQHKSAKLRELEEELLGDGLKDRRKEAADQVDGEKVEEMDEEDYGEA